MADKLKVKVIIGTTRQGRFSEKPAQWIFDLAKARPDFDVELLDLRDYQMPFFDEAATPAYKKEPYKNETVAAWTKKIAEGDAFIVVTGEYNHGYPAVLKNAFDWVYPEWNKKAVAFVSYGSVGGSRSVEQLRQVAVEVQMAPIRAAVHIPWDTYVKLIGYGVPQEPDALKALDQPAGAMLEQLAWWSGALKAARAQA